eukprot:TRINITY_DN10287_c0_g1_i1.p1 TRINITY_DN10287_c0_g1~~TRINITY_DN10287_c0_g1_i1.p1  ORF type:complete len:102 (-),score=19.40 TRINITY_DN10287_c0_g1_i1:69-341(-)
MDSELEKTLQSINSQNGVLGTLCADVNGLCLMALGSAPSQAAGSLTAIINRAKSLSPNEEPQVVVLETESSTVLIRKEGDITLGVFKIPQ